MTAKIISKLIHGSFAIGILYFLIDDIGWLIQRAVNADVGLRVFELFVDHIFDWFRYWRATISQIFYSIMGVGVLFITLYCWLKIKLRFKYLFAAPAIYVIGFFLTFYVGNWQYVLLQPLDYTINWIFLISFIPIVIMTARTGEEILQLSQESLIDDSADKIVPNPKHIFSRLLGGALMAGFLWQVLISIGGLFTLFYDSASEHLSIFVRDFFAFYPDAVAKSVIILVIYLWMRYRFKASTLVAFTIAILFGAINYVWNIFSGGLSIGSLWQFVQLVPHILIGLIAIWIFKDWKPEEEWQPLTEENTI